MKISGLAPRECSGQIKKNECTFLQIKWNQEFGIEGLVVGFGEIDWMFKMSHKSKKVTIFFFWFDHFIGARGSSIKDVGIF